MAAQTQEVVLNVYYCAKSYNNGTDNSKKVGQSLLGLTGAQHQAKLLAGRYYQYSHGGKDYPSGSSTDTTFFANGSNLFLNRQAVIFFSSAAFSNGKDLLSQLESPSGFKSQFIKVWSQASASDKDRRFIIAKNCPEYDQNSSNETIKNVALSCARDLTQAIQQLKPVEFSRLSYSDNTESINFIRGYSYSPYGAPATVYKYFLITCSNFRALKRAGKIKVYLQIEDGENEYLNSTPFSEEQFDRYTGFFYRAGYYEKGAAMPNRNLASLVSDENKYISVSINTNNGFTMDTEGPVSDINELASASGRKYYKLYNSNGINGNINYPYYTEVSASGQSISGSGSSSSVTTPTFSITLPDFTAKTFEDVDYTEVADLDADNYIYDFSKYKVNFIPITNISKDLMDNVNKAIATFNLDMGTTEKGRQAAKVKISNAIITREELIEILDSYNSQFTIKLKIINKTNSQDIISLTDYFSDDTNKGLYDFLYYKIVNGEEQYIDIDFKEYLTFANENLRYTINKDSGMSFNVEMSLNQEAGEMNIRSLELFEAFTRGRDFIEENYTIVRPQERDPDKLDNETSRCMNYDENYFVYKYSGRDIDIFCQKQEEELCMLPQDYDSTDNYPTQPVYYALIHSADLLLESDVTLGETYGEQKYFIEAVKTPRWKGDNEQQINKDEIKYPTGDYDYTDSFKMINYLEDGIDPTLYTEDDLEIVTSKIDLTRCKYYNPLAATFENNWCDCTYGGETNKECLYQKAGYCPYRFQSEKHPRRIRTLRQSKSNRFNLIQELCKTFKFYPYFYIEHEKNGTVKLNENGEMLKHVFFMTEKGNNNAMGFRYEKNLSNTTRTIDSSAITTKLYVESVDSSYANDGLCSIQTATDNISRNSYILDFSYYIKMGMLDADTVQRDLYGIDEGDFAFLTRIGKFNEQYDEYSNLIITMTGQTLNELEAEIIVSTTGVTTALEERKKISQQMYQFKASSSTNNYKIDVDYTTSDTYINYLTKYREQATILWGLIETLFFSNNYFSLPKKDSVKDIYTFTTYNYEELQSYNYENKETLPSDVPEWGEYTKIYCRGEFFWRLLLEGFEEDKTYIPIFDHWNDCMEILVEPKLYEINGKLGKYRSLYNEVQYWKRERAKILNKINDLSEQFYHKYESYLKEGTFTDSNFLTDNEYYWGGVSVLADSCEPKLTYTFSVIDISALPEYKDDYTFELADTTFVEDIDFFGINSHTGFPNKEQVLITTLTENLDNPSKNSIEVKNYTTSFDDLFGSITASVQSLTYNENVYKRASNFTAQQYVTTDSLQDTLDIGDLTLLDTAKQNIQLDEQGTEGNDINNTASQYKQTGEGIYFSTDGGETWDLGIGPKGINMDYAKFGSLDASKIQIVDGDYIYFLWDKDGLNAYRDPSASTEGLLDFARFNRYGLSLIENGNVRLRAGYEYRSNEFGNNITGDYTQEIALKDQNIGFYLYNDSGQPIFKTETQSSYDDDSSDYSARLSMTGEMFVTNRILDSGGITTNINNVYYEKTLSDEYYFENKTVVFTQSETDTDIEEDEKRIFSILSQFNSPFKAGDMVILNDDLIQVEKIIFGEDYQCYKIESVTDTTLPGYSSVDQIYLSGTKITLDSTDEINNVGVDQLSKEDLNKLLIGTDIDIEVDDEIITIKPYGVSSILNSSYYIDIQDGKLLLLIPQVLLINTGHDEAKTLSTEDQTLSQKEVTYYIEENGEYIQQKISLYAYQNFGGITYWKNYNNDTNSPIGQFVDDFSLSEIGVFINNKKALKVNLGEAIDNTNLDSQLLSDNEEQQNEAIKAILSGAERTFSIVAGGSDADGNFAYKNILSVLKNGVLYMGGTVNDIRGKNLDLSSLSYLPDEISINKPTFILSNMGYIWCNWKKFFNMGDDGMLTTTSLAHVFDEYNERFTDLINELNDYFATLQDYFSSMSFYGQGATGYYIDDPGTDI